MTLKNRRVGGLALLCMLASAVAGAAEPPTTINSQFQTPTTVYFRPGGDYQSDEPGADPFSWKRSELDLGGQGLWVDGRRGGGGESIGFLTADLGWYFTRHWSLNLEAGIAPGGYRGHGNPRDESFFNDDEDDFDDGGGSSYHLRAEEEMVLLRWHFLRTRGTSLFVDAGVGGIHAKGGFPTDGATDNWIVAAGMGVDLRLDTHWFLQAGARAARLSGGDLFERHGSSRASDGFQYFAAFVYLQ